MTGFKILSRHWFKFGIIAIFLISLGLRFWGLSRFNVLVFDEVYYVKFANNYLTHTPFFDGHPPLSKYLIAIGIWLGEQFPWVQELPKNELAGSPLSTWSYRWLNALTGSFLPLIVMGLAYQLSYRRSFSLIAGILTAADGLLLVESRYALNNIYLLLFGLLGQWFFLLALEPPPDQQNQRILKSQVWALLSGLCFGAATSIKWNGLWFLAGIYVLWIVAWVVRGLTHPHSGPYRPEFSPTLGLQRLTQFNAVTFGFYLGVIPLLTYFLVWLPHLQLNPTPGLLEVQAEILSYHQRVGGNDPSVHPYCSPWYTWPWMLRPVAYFYEAVTNPSTQQVDTVYFVNAIGNPILWWSSTIAVITLVGLLVQQIPTLAIPARQTHSEPDSFSKPAQQPSGGLWVPLYLLTNYVANFLPWTRVTRCSFLYHYMGSAIFATLILAWFLDQGWHNQEFPWQRQLSLWLLGLILIAFVFWMPIYLGLPMTPTEMQLRQWLRSWV